MSLFHSILRDELLTDKQFDTYIEIDTRRTFNIGNKKIKSFIDKYEKYRR